MVNSPEKLYVESVNLRTRVKIIRSTIPVWSREMVYHGLKFFC